MSDPKMDDRLVGLDEEMNAFLKRKRLESAVDVDVALSEVRRGVWVSEEAWSALLSVGNPAELVSAFQGVVWGPSQTSMSQYLVRAQQICVEPYLGLWSSSELKVLSGVANQEYRWWLQAQLDVTPVRVCDSDLVDVTMYDIFPEVKASVIRKVVMAGSSVLHVLEAWVHPDRQCAWEPTDVDLWVSSTEVDAKELDGWETSCVVTRRGSSVLEFETYPVKTQLIYTGHRTPQDLVLSFDSSLLFVYEADGGLYASPLTLYQVKKGVVLDWQTSRRNGFERFHKYLSRGYTSQTVGPRFALEYPVVNLRPKPLGHFTGSLQPLSFQVDYAKGYLYPHQNVAALRSQWAYPGYTVSADAGVVLRVYVVSVVPVASSHRKLFWVRVKHHGLLVPLMKGPLPGGQVICRIVEEGQCVEFRTYVAPVSVGWHTVLFSPEGVIHAFLS